MAKKLKYKNGKFVVEDDKQRISLPKGYLDEKDGPKLTDLRKHSPFESIPEIEEAKEDLYDFFDPEGKAMLPRAIGDLLTPTSLAEISAGGILGAKKPFGVPRKIPKVTRGKFGIEISERIPVDKTKKLLEESMDRLAKTDDILKRTEDTLKTPNVKEMAPFREYQGTKLSKGEAFKDEVSLPKFTKESGMLSIPGKHARGKHLIEKSGGTDIRVSDDGIATWIDKEGNKRSANLNERFGSRQLGTSPREQGIAPRQTGTNDRSPVLNEMRTAGGVKPTAAFTRAERLAKKNKKPSLVQQVREAIKNKPKRDMSEEEAFAGFTDEAEARLNKTRDKLGADDPPLDLDDPDVEKLYSGLPPPKRRIDKIRESKAQPENLSLKGSYKYETSYNNAPLKFATDFDKAVYTLTTKPNFAMMKEIMNKTGLTEDVIKAHGEALKKAIESGVKPGIKGMKQKTFDVPIKPLIVERDPEKLSLLKEAIIAPSQTKFGGDISPALRQSFRPTVLHPIKSGLPAIKNAFRSIKEEGFNKVMEELAESPIYKRLEQNKALPGATEKLYPNIKELERLPSNDLGAFFTESAPLEKIPLLGKGYLKPSRRMFDSFQKTIRGKEMERLTEKIPGGIDELLTDPDLANELRAIVNRVSDETGHGTLGVKGDKALDALSYAFTAPRNLAAKFQFYNPLNYMPEGVVNKIGVGGHNLGKFRRDIGSGVAYKDFLKDQAKLTAGTGAGLYAADQAGADVDVNPLSANFGVKFGDFKPDLFGGELGLIRQLARTAQPFNTERVSSKGNTYDRVDNYGNDLARFFRGRVRPGLPSMAVDSIFGGDPDTGKRLNYLGEDIEMPYQEGEFGNEALDTVGLGDKPYSRWIAQQFTPALPGDIMDASEEGLGTGLAAAGLGFFGGGSTTYNPYEFNPYKPPKKFIRVPRRKPGELEKKQRKQGDFKLRTIS